jgi:prophage antirepressor-like protein
MSALTVFQFEQQSIRTAVVDGQPVFCLLDLLRAMGSTTAAHKARYSLQEVFGEEGFIELPLQTAGGIQNAVFVFQPSMTYLISRSRTEAGKNLNRFMHTEVLPSIHKTGTFGIEKLSRREILQLALEAEDRVSGGGACLTLAI